MPQSGFLMLTPEMTNRGAALKEIDAAFEEMYQARYRTVFRYIYQRVNDRELAEDLTSEVFLRAYTKHQLGKPTKFAWLVTTARNLIGNTYQRRVTEQQHVQRVMFEELVELGELDRQIEDLELKLALLALKPLDALVLQLTYWDGLSASEAAKVMDCSTPALWARLSRARNALRAALETSHDVLQPGQAAQITPPRQPVQRHEGGSTHG